jgi:pimeloyl-ACP methyl ester carboxylesterase
MLRLLRSVRAGRAGFVLSALASFSAACAEPDGSSPNETEPSLEEVTGRLAYTAEQVNSQLAVPLAAGTWGQRMDFCPFDRGLNLRNARWLAWISANSYDDHFGTWADQHVEGIAAVRYPGAIFTAFRSLGFGQDGEDRLWAQDGVQLANHFRRFGAIDDALATRMFTTLDPTRGMGKLHGTDPMGYRDGREVFTMMSTQAYFIHHRALRTVVVGFRGTQGGDDVNVDLDYDLVRFDDGANPSDPDVGVQVHRGFRNAMFERTGAKSSIEARLIERLRSVPNDTQLWITGHSLGGALANLFTLRALREQQSGEGARFKLAGLVTFGAPEVGNAAFGTELRTRLLRAGALHQRFVYGRDPVPRVVEFGRGFITLFRELDSYQHATRLEDYGLLGGGPWAGAMHGSIEVQLPCNRDNPAGQRVRWSTPVPRSHARCELGSAAIEGQLDHGIANYYNALVLAERQAPPSDPAARCDATTRWRGSCARLLSCLGGLGGGSCVSDASCAGGVCDDLRACADGGGGWGCFEATCGAAPAVPAASRSSVQSCWSGGGGFSCFRR